MQIFAAVVLLVAMAALVAGAAGEPIELTDETFDAAVFPSDVPFEKQTPYFIFFYAPWCGHCKKTKPIFQNASDVLQSSPYATEHAKFALVDATAQKELAKRFRVKSFPTFFYTVSGRGYAYEGGRGLQEFVQASVYVFRGHQLGGFADDVSTPERFDQVEKEAPGRAVFLVYVPRGAPGAHSKRLVNSVDRATYSAASEAERILLESADRDSATPHAWNIAVESSITLGKSRFGVVYEDRIPQTKDSEKTAFSAMKAVAARCKEVSKGPNGVMMILMSDAYREPLCYLGPWLKSNDAQLGSNALNMPLGYAKLHVHPDMRDWIDRNAFLAVEEISSETYASLSRRNGLLVVLVADRTLAKDDQTMLPVLRNIVQERNALRLSAEDALKKAKTEDHIDVASESSSTTSKPPLEFIFAHMDGVVFHEWCVQNGLEPSDYPALLVVSPMKEIAYHAKNYPSFLAVKDDLPWTIGGEQELEIKAFLAAVERGECVAYRSSTIGKIAEVVLKIPFAPFLHEKLGGDDTTFLTVIFVIVFTIFVLALALRPESPKMAAEREQWMREQAARDNERRRQQRPRTATKEE